MPQFGAGECLCVFKYLRVLKYFDFKKNPHTQAPGQNVWKCSLGKSALDQRWAEVP